MCNGQWAAKNTDLPGKVDAEIIDARCISILKPIHTMLAHSLPSGCVIFYIGQLPSCRLAHSDIEILLLKSDAGMAYENIDMRGPAGCTEIDNGRCRRKNKSSSEANVEIVQS